MGAIHGIAGGCVAFGLIFAGYDSKKGRSPSLMLRFAGVCFFIYSVTSF